VAVDGAGDTDGLIAGDTSETDADGLGPAIDGAGDTDGLCRVRHGVGYRG
jgi:hypothetical protein